MLNFKTVSIEDEVRYDMDIVEKDVKIGYLTLFVCDGIAYMGSLEIFEDYRNKGYGTAVIKEFAERYEGVYICPTNADNERLYARLGEYVDPDEVPDCYNNLYDNFDAVYFVE